MSKLKIVSKEIISILKTEMNGSEINAVNSREIYEYLEVGTRYNDWINRAIEKYDFEENVDYSKMSTPNPKGQTIIDYIVTLDMAKELCMVSTTPKGKITRKYFIEVEKEANKPMTIDQLLAYNAKVISNLKNENLVLVQQNQEMKPKVLFADSVAQSEQSISVGQFAKLISTDDFSIGQNRLFKWFRSNGYLHSKNSQYNQPLQRYKEQGLFETIERIVTKKDGTFLLTIKAMVTGKGQVYFTNKLIPNHES